MARSSASAGASSASAPDHKWPQTVKERSTRAHGRRTLVKLLDAAEAEFAAHGWHGARMARLAKRAGTAHGTVYAYFADKDDLLFALWREVGTELRSTLLAMPTLEPGPDGFARIRQWVGEVCSCFRRHSAVFHAVTEALADEESSRGGKAALRDQRRILAVFEDRIRAAGPTGLDPAVAALCVYAIIEGANESVHRGELLVSDQELVTGLSEFVQQSIFGSGAASAPRRK